MLEPKSITDSRRSQAGGGQASSNYQNTQAQNSNNYSNNQSQKSNMNKPSENSFADINFDSGNPFESNDDVTDISDDDLPF